MSAIKVARVMTEGTPWKHILSFAVPVMLGALLHQLYHTADTAIVGLYAGEDALSAVGTTGSFIFLFLAVASGLSSGNGVVIAQHLGAGDEKKMRAAASTGLILLTVVGLLVTLLAFLVARPACRYLIAVPDSLMDMALTYFYIYLVGIVFQFIYSALAAILRAVGDSASTLYFLIVSSLINIALDVLFVSVFHWGVAGAAWATNIAQLFSVLVAYVYMVRKYPVFRFARKDYLYDSLSARQTVNVGFPIALQLVLVALGLTLIQRAVNGFGTAMTASYAVAFRIEAYMNLPANAFHTALATYTGQNIGAGREDRVTWGARQTVLVSLIFTLFISACLYLFAPQVAGIFGLGEQALSYCTAHLHAVALVFIILSLYIPLFGVFQGSNHSIVPTVVAICALTTRVGMVYLLKDSSFLGYTIIWWNGVFGFTVGCLVSWSYYLSGRWKHNARLS